MSIFSLQNCRTILFSPAPSLFLSSVYFCFTFPFTTILLDGMNDHREIPVTVRTTSGTGLRGYDTNTNNNPYVYISPVPPSSAATSRESLLRFEIVFFVAKFLLLDSIPFLLYMISGPNPICEALTHCSRKVEEATKQAELMVDNLWNHREFCFPPTLTITRFINRLSKYLTVAILHLQLEFLYQSHN